ncbi:tRNA (uridine(54)-C5)-methyltransferase TrmA [Pseudoalteromonas shioyasakiensis]|jgi:tRNA (uracil-5-)-methyltransferase|uniref:tRNA/tmRNA (uracil-C(5))-methyltransferase n=1 Tax=Pseudoalteromonas shioyasakiensis TaxID=1190813 RepID=A0ABT6U5M5_9GAMM|nr:MULTISPECIES: tRNA (uridine(54)-C5)-methyltransferase TrmA [Pseudoalteromonas]MCO6355377.1 tRNA (uridine(54)-C5)-methyltransferase TrmA [Pseudoalteromonas shioyasakiensis]MDI4671484.1 tRNA (uridine(54)-C5)-methyltransferase TrmA [Pseudoalteromonas shioyasakiensis]MDI4673546.1 tRNA (uridine(54)-C5)-methyltransferase TrmA [Pseudoalteromonas shioyasakiensis]MDI4688393.1 tRNA (uridine(54)-C5)-methyltransferase TrmA [Pseudoalteromonas shioyasakiensis]MDI4707009.1 tRNA (uridine(54)-C5)-methyltran
MAVIKIDTTQYDAQLSEKEQRITSQFRRFGVEKLEVFGSDPIHYRQRAEFRVWHEGEDLFHIMFDQQTKEKIRVDEFDPAAPLVGEVMQAMIENLKDNEVLRRKLFQIDYLSSLSGEILVSLLYHKQLDEQWLQAIKELKAKLSTQFKIDFIGRARKQKEVIGNDYVIERLNVNGKELIYQQVENSFTQPNAKVNIKMLEWAQALCQPLSNDLLELYCGNGNFSIALAGSFDRVLATEISKSSVYSAQYNIAQNKVENLDIIRMSSEEFTQAMKGERTFSRLDGIDLKSYNCQTILVDPPRAGMDTLTCDLVANYDNIIYISCNPDTLERDLDHLCKTHEVKRFAIFDQFPYTHHIESGVFLQRK